MGIHLKITVAGAGYVGLSLATLLAKENDVTLIDVVEEKIDLINDWKSPIKDDEIEAAFERASIGAEALSLAAVMDAELAYVGADVIIVSTPTNYDSEMNKFDTSSVEEVISTARSYNEDAWIVIKSTIPVGYTAAISASRHDDRIAFSPEFLREGKALYDNLHPSRIVVGIVSQDAASREFAELFAGALASCSLENPPSIPVLICGSTEAEAIKLFANTYLALRISYFNELDTYAAVRGLDTKKIIEGVGLDPRIGGHYNNPSFGYGGYCLPKDSKQLLANYNDVPQELISAIVETNDTRKDFIANDIVATIADIDEPVVGIYRLAMKKGSDNFRQSSIQGIMERLAGRGVTMVIYEPTIEAQTYNNVEVIDDLAKFIETSDLIVANRMNEELRAAKPKVYTRDLFNRD